MTIEDKAKSLIDTWGKETAITKLKTVIFNTEVSFDKMGYTPADLRNVKEWKQILKAMETL
jgi:hypothetical protein